MAVGKVAGMVGECLGMGWFGMLNLTKNCEGQILRERIKLSTRLLGGGFKYFIFSPLPGEMIQSD